MRGHAGLVAPVDLEFGDPPVFKQLRFGSPIATLIGAPTASRLHKGSSNRFDSDAVLTCEPKTKVWLGGVSWSQGFTPGSSPPGTDPSISESFCASLVTPRVHSRTTLFGNLAHCRAGGIAGAGNHESSAHLGAGSRDLGARSGSGEAGGQSAHLSAPSGSV